MNYQIISNFFNEFNLLNEKSNLIHILTNTHRNFKYC